MDMFKRINAFTLIEMMVAVSLFAIVMMVGVGALLSLVEANKRAQALNSVINNINIAVESMARSIRVGTNYHCETDADSVPPPETLAATSDCELGNGVLLAFESADGDPTDPDDQVVYRYVVVGDSEKRIERSLEGGANGTWVALTAPEVVIEEFELFVAGTTVGDGNQPRVLMSIKASAVVPGGTTEFTVQSSVVQRLLDI
jgi:prepilin-type N-terminal cleavage/methylation domain-containing protein